MKNAVAYWKDRQDQTMTRPKSVQRCDMMSEDGIAQWYWDKIWQIWNERANPEILEQILEYLAKISIHSTDPSVRSEAERTKFLLENEATRKDFNHPPSKANAPTNAFSNHFREQKPIELEDDLPLKIDDLLLVEKPNVTFDKIGGLANTKELLKMEIIYPRLHPEKYKLYGRVPGNGVLLWGAPGCGKTMLAKAIAKESGETTFISPKVSDVMNRWVGQSEKIVSAIFKYARTFPRATLFLDEIDYVAPRTGPSYMMRIKRELLQQMDGVSTKKEGLLVFGATNRPWMLDPAARRPSPEGLRFSKIILVPPPDFEARLEIFRLSLSKINQEMVSNDVDLNELAELSHGFSGADIGAACEEAVDIPLNEHIKGESPRPVCMDDFRQVLTTKSKSIVPWIVDGLRSARRYGEKALGLQLAGLAREYLDNDDSAREV